VVGWPVCEPGGAPPPCSRSSSSRAPRCGPPLAKRPSLPVEAFFADPASSGAQLSPDGRHLVALAAAGDEQYVVVWNLATRQRKPLVRFPKREMAKGRPVDSHLSSVFFVGNDRIALSLDLTVPFSGKAFLVQGLYAVDREGGDVAELSKRWLGQKFFAHEVTGIREDPRHVLVFGRSAAKSFATLASGGFRVEIQKVDVRTGAHKLHQASHRDVDEWIVDGKRGRVRLGVGYHDQRKFVYSVDSSVSMDLLRKLRLLHESDFAPLAFGSETLYVASSHEGDTYALYEFDEKEKSFRKKLFEAVRFDVASVLVSEKRDALLAAGYVEDVSRYHFFDEEFGREMAALEQALPGRELEPSWDRAEDRWIVRASGDVHPPASYLYERAKKQLMLMSEERPALRAEQLSQGRAVDIQARDGLALRGYLTLPRGRPESKLPSVLLIHGGPLARDRLSWNPEVQFLASRGYAVLRLNFRGSWGYGRKFAEAGWRQWGLAMQDDVADAAKWLIDQGIADPDRIAIYGASYGGYAALMGVIRNPELFRCAVSLAGATQIPKLLGRAARYFGATAEHLNLETDGDWIADAEHLRSVSPAENAERVGAPVLIAHGTLDFTVDPEQARLMADALTRAGKPFELLMLENEPHGLLFEATRLEFYRALEAFLAKHTQPRPPPAPAEAPAS